MSNPIVNTSEGKLKGKVCKTTNNIQFYSFKGIPYAKPPIGDLRFSAPTLPETWEGIRDATKDCNICAQLDRETKTVLGDEDCLYLNVYTPKLPIAGSSPLPVMIFFHGGGFVFGSGTDDSAHGPDYLVEKDVVIVSLNYRLGILGFLCLNCKEAPGNMGLKDQVQALKWVKQNISNFGGDSNNVTIFGVSAGGASVEYHLLSLVSKGLFHKAIAQSGSSLLCWAQNHDVQQLARKLPLLKGQVISDDKKLLQYLRDLPIKELITLSMLALAAEKFRGGINFGYVPTIEIEGDWEPFLTENTYDLLAKGEFNKTPYIAGFCSREGLLMVGHGAALLDDLSKEKNFIKHLPFNVDDTESTEMERKLKNVYLEEESTYKDSDAFAIDFFTDVAFLGGVYVSTSLIAKNNSPTYFYEFAYDGGLNYLKKKLGINREGACHGDEGGYLIKSDKLVDPPSPTDEKVKERLVTMWTNFAKCGEPTPETNDLITTKWEPIADTGFAYLFIDDKLTMKNNPYPARMKLYEELYEKYYK